MDLEIYTMPQAVAGLTAHAVNSLDMEFPCCPHSCAPCGALYTLNHKGVLTATIRPYVEMSGGDWDWWVDGRFDWQWVLARWCDLGACDWGQLDPDTD